MPGLLVGWTVSLILLTGSVYANSGRNPARPSLYLNGEWRAAHAPAANPSPSRASTLGPLARPATDFAPASLAENFLWKNARALGLTKRSDLKTQTVTSGDGFTTVRLARSREVVVDGRALALELRGGETLVHLRNGNVLFAAANVSPAANKTYRTQVTPDAAAAIAFADYGTAARAAKTPELKLVLSSAFGQDTEERLAFAVKVEDENEFESNTTYVDATTGELLYSVPSIQTHRQRVVMVGGAERADERKLLDVIAANTATADGEARVQPEAKFPIYLSDIGCRPDTLLPSPAEPSTAPGITPAPCYDEQRPAALAAARFAWRNSGLVWEYFKLRHGRDSFDGRGTPIRSLVHFLPQWGNAAWVSEANVMIYGDGDPDRHHPIARALDVAAHELTHAITSKTANLEYVAESGALNESYADVFGKLVAAETQGFQDWKIGRDYYRDSSRFIRDMENPEVPHVDNFRFRGAVCSSRNDNCGVHSNSGIPNRAAVLIANRIGREALGKIYYRTLTQLLRPSSNFADARTQTLVACELIYGQNSENCAAVADSFSAVGIR